ncbi:MAG: hypothetical protein U5R06_24460 [candidate division KSB1 bacterium]|nr:hypothetical protein [candidate division KSB1 bacterium]
MPFVYDQLVSSALALHTGSLSFSVPAGETVEDTLILVNQSSERVSYACIDEQIPLAWQMNSFNAFDNSSWWCGDTEVGGYDNRRLQYLDTPVLDLSETESPQLSFMTFWAIEYPQGAKYPYDGWDGSNVWISVDSGRTFHVINPLYPDYSSQSLWSFGEAVQGWNMGY